MAPLAPLVTEEVWRGLTGGRSVHLADWPTVQHGASDDVLVADPGLVAAMDEVREIVSATLGLRKAHGLRVRQPLRELAVAVAVPAALEPYVELIASELNIKHVTLVDLAEMSLADLGVTTRLSVNARAAGPRLGRRVQDVIRAAKAGRWAREADGVVVQTDDGPVALEETEYDLATVVADDAAEGQVAAVLPDDGVVLLDTTLDDGLRAEGFARDVVRLVQDERKAAGLQVSDRIRLTLSVPADQVAAVEVHAGMIAKETLATELAVSVGDGEPAATVVRAQT
jgi:isoleucyl-tRNA synthetase